jgi:hypothetical protein
MGLLGWWKGRSGQEESPKLREWRGAWLAAITSASPADAVASLERSLRELALPSDDLEVEEEMLDGLRALAGLAGDLDRGSWPVVETGHRIVAADVCHFSAPASAPDTADQSSGRVLLTNHRALFTGGGRSVAVAWHRINEVLRSDRDVLIVQHGGETAHRFRFNSFADALCATALARRLSGRTNGRSPAV